LVLNVFRHGVKICFSMISSQSAVIYVQEMNPVTNTFFGACCASG